MILKLIRWYVAWKLGRSLDGVWVGNLERTRRAVERQPVIFAANHVAWWDALLLIALDAALGGGGKALMDAANLARLPFFRWVGALPLDRSGGAAALAGLRNAARALGSTARSLWIFPQGRQRPAHLRPLGFARGVELLIRLTKVPVVPVSVQYVFREEANPAAVVWFGEPLTAPTLAELEDAVEHGLAQIDAWADTGEGSFQPLVATRAVRTDRGLGARLLAWVAS